VCPEPRCSCARASRVRLARRRNVGGRPQTSKGEVQVERVGHHARCWWRCSASFGRPVLQCFSFGRRGVVQEVRRLKRRSVGVARNAAREVGETLERRRSSGGDRSLCRIYFLRNETDSLLEQSLGGGTVWNVTRLWVTISKRLNDAVIITASRG